MTITGTPAEPSSSSGGGARGASTSEDEDGREGVLRLRGHHQPSRRRPGVRWTDDTVDNEHMGKKKSKSALLPFPMPSAARVPRACASA